MIEDKGVEEEINKNENKKGSKSAGGRSLRSRDGGTSHVCHGHSGCKDLLFGRQSPKAPFPLPAHASRSSRLLPLSTHQNSDSPKAEQPSMVCALDQCLAHGSLPCKHFAEHKKPAQATSWKGQRSELLCTHKQNILLKPTPKQ